jgi:hypothetical protein
MKIYIKDASHFFKGDQPDVRYIEDEDIEFVRRIKPDDWIVLNQVGDINNHYEEIFKECKALNKTPKIIIVQTTEYIHDGDRERYLSNYPNVLFISPHADLTSIQNDLPISYAMYAFNVAFPKKYLKPFFYDQLIGKKRSKKYNFFNRAINLRRMKILELILKNGLDTNDSYTTFGLFISKKDFQNINTPTEYLNWIDSFNNLNIDVNYLEANSDKFGLIEDNTFHSDKAAQFGETEFDSSFFNSVIDYSLDSYVSFIIETSGSNTFSDCKFSEKTIRALLCKNIFLTIGSNGFNNGLKVKGIETFEDVFGLEPDWDEIVSEPEKIKIFYDKLNEFSKLTIAEVAKLYNRKDIQLRLEKNHRLALEGLTDNPIEIMLDK